MTQIRSLHRAPPRRPGALGVHAIDSFDLVVPDLKQAGTFYKHFGLDVREEGDALRQFGVQQRDPPAGFESNGWGPTPPADFVTNHARMV